jgi:hypothetical protein
MKMNKKLDNFLGIQSEKKSSAKILEILENQRELDSDQEILPPQTAGMRKQQSDEDFDFARDNIRAVIMTATESLSELSIIAKSSQEARAFEVLAKTVDSLVNANKSLVELTDKKAEESKDTKNGPQTVNNNLFVGTTNDLLDMLEKRKQSND